ncbi:unnamed protein product [Boreogadus saida]
MEDGHLKEFQKESLTLERDLNGYSRCKRRVQISDFKLGPIRINGGWTPKGIPKGESDVGKGPKWIFKMTFRPVMRRLFLPRWIDGEPCGSPTSALFELKLGSSAEELPPTFERSAYEYS